MSNLVSARERMNAMSHWIVKEKTYYVPSSSFSAGKEYNWMIMKPTTAFTSLKSHQSFQGVNEDPKDPAPSFDSCNLNKFWYFL